MRSPIQLLTTTLLLCTLPHTTKAQALEVSGTISIPTIWITGTSVSITSDVTITEPGTLIVQPGVRIDFDGPYSIFVRSTVNLDGNATHPIEIKNGAKAFSLMEQALSASLTARHAIFENFSGGAIMREWPSTTQLPTIVVEDCTFVNSEYAVRAFDVQVSNSVIRGGRIGASLHRAIVRNTTMEDCSEICLFAGSESRVHDSSIQNCGTIGLQIHGEALNTTVSNAAEGISGVIVAWEDRVEPAQVNDCIVKEVSNIGLQYIEQTTGTIVQDSPNAIGALLGNNAVLDKSVIVGNRVGVATSDLAGESVSITITDSYVCGNDEAQFDAVDFSGTSNANRVYFGNTVEASEGGTIGELLQALPFLSTAQGTLDYDVSDSVVEEIDTDLLVQANVDEMCGASQNSPTASPDASSPTTSPSTPAPTPAATVIQRPKQAPATAKCGSIGLSSGRGGAAGQAKGCTSSRVTDNEPTDGIRVTGVRVTKYGKMRLRGLRN